MKDGDRMIGVVGMSRKQMKRTTPTSKHWQDSAISAEAWVIMPAPALLPSRLAALVREARLALLKEALRA